METQAISLNVHPQIIDLYEVLDKQKEDVQSLVGYIESMEYNLSVMMNEIQEMHTEVNRLHDKGIRAQCAKIVSKVEDKVQQAKTMISVAKVKMIQSAENAVKAFQEKGKSALIHVVEAMRIPAALSKIKDIFSHAAQSMRQSAGQLDVIRGELHEVGGHMKNAGRVILGKPAKQTGTLEADKGALAKLRGFLESCGKAFSNMERSADRLMEKMQRTKEPEEKKPSVKSEHSEKSKAPVVKEQAR
mgnify:CR=1 FL=1